MTNPPNKIACSQCWGSGVTLLGHQCGCGAFQRAVINQPQELRQRVEILEQQVAYLMRRDAEKSK